jgi:hypothetical protein
MNPLLRLLAVGTLLFTGITTFAASAFEGRITLAMTAEKGRAQDVNFVIKGKKARMEMKAGGSEAIIITDSDKMESIMLMPEQKMYMVLPVQKVVEKAAAKANEKEADVEVTGRTETILGYKCNELLVKDKNTVTEVWMAEDLGAFTGLGSGGGPFGGKKGANAAKWEEVMKEKGGFPLRVISRNAKAKETFKMEATKVEPGPLPDSLFVPPADYQKFQMPSMGDIMKGMGQ